MSSISFIKPLLQGNTAEAFLQNNLSEWTEINSSFPQGSSQELCYLRLTNIPAVHVFKKYVPSYKSNEVAFDIQN